MADKITPSRPPNTHLVSKSPEFSAVHDTLGRVVPDYIHLKIEEPPVSLPPDIWFLIAYAYLVDFPATVAALSSTSRRFHILLRSLKFGSVSIRFNTSSTPIEIRSSARRFVKKIHDDRQIISYIETMEIGYEHHGRSFVGVPAVDDAVPRNIHERSAFRYILSQQYPILKRLALSIFKDVYVFQFPADVFDALYSAFSLKSLREISLAAAMPPELSHPLQQIDTLNLRTPYILGRPSAVVTKKCAPQTLRIIAVGTVRELFPHDRPYTISLERLTTLDLKIDPRAVSDYIPWSFSSCYSTLINLKIFFDPWHRINQVYDNINLAKFTALKTLTLGFNLSRSSPHSESNSQQLQWVIDALLTIVEAEQPLSIETVTLLIGDVKASAGWIERVEGLPWSHLQKLFSSEYVPLRWSQLQGVNICLAAKKKNALSSSNRALLEKALILRLANGFHNGLFRVRVHGRADPLDFDEFWPTAPHSIN